jgi:uncharacterized membrane protein YjjP (DUF1212 family)
LSASSSLADALDALLRFGAVMLRSGEAAFRVREDMEILAPRLGIERFAMLVTITTLTATGRYGSEALTLVQHVGPLGINAERLGALERLVRDCPPRLAPSELHAKLDAIEATPPVHPLARVAVAVGVASASFAWLNGGAPAEMLAAFVAGALGQSIRTLLLRRHLNQYAVTALCAVAAATVYCLAAAGLARAGMAPGHGVGVVAAALFLVPGFPLVAALLDLVQDQTPAGLARLAYGTLLLSVAAVGLGVVVAVVGFPAAAAAASPLDLSTTLLLRGVLSFAGGCGFAVLYNAPWRTVLVVGVLAIAGNELRLGLQDLGASQAAATFAGALVVGLLASLAQHRLSERRIELTVPGIIIMVPGSAAFQSFVLFGRGDVLGGLQEAVVVVFVVGAMALGLAVARFASERKWLFQK